MLLHLDSLTGQALLRGLSRCVIFLVSITRYCRNTIQPFRCRRTSGRWLTRHQSEHAVTTGFNVAYLTNPHFTDAKLGSSTEYR
jgi:hypothetical protein